MEYKRFNTKKLSLMPINDKLLYEIAVLFAKTGFYEPARKINNPGRDPFETYLSSPHIMYQSKVYNSPY